MTNEEKAIELDNKFKNFMYSPKQGPSFQQCLTEMAEWKEEQMLDKACEWLIDNVNNYIINDKSSGKDWLKVKSEMFDDFKKAMEK